MTEYRYRPIHYFDEIVHRNRDARALIWSESVAVTYGELSAYANRAANFLVERGISKGKPVAIVLDKTTATYAIILACQRIGTAYFAIDPANPRDRTRYILSKCQPGVVFADRSSQWLESEWPTVVIEPDSDPFAAFDSTAPRADTAVTGSDPAYIMFTSGSTGFPKGVAISNDNLALFIQWARWQFDTRPTDIFTNLNPLYFDNSVFDIYASLFSGAALVPFTANELREPNSVLAKIDALGCTNFFSVPSLLIYFQTLKLIEKSTFRSMKKIVFGGEGYPKARLKELHDAIGDRVTLYNVYGPTECTCICSVYVVTDEDFRDMTGLPPLGELIPNFSYAIFDSDRNPVPDGQTGELYLGGPCVGIGYYGDRELTEKAFVLHPMNSQWPERMYKTGDLVSYNPADGKLHIAGRADTQIKHQGYRIELGEIESALNRVAGVDEAVALQAIRGGVSQIVAIVASRSDVDGKKIRAALAESLPRYMIPSLVDVLRELPKNPNGKIDRFALREKYSK